VTKSTKDVPAATGKLRFTGHFLSRPDFNGGKVALPVALPAGRARLAADFAVLEDNLVALDGHLSALDEDKVRLEGHLVTLDGNKV
jgi:hypothetical protein